MIRIKDVIINFIISMAAGASWDFVSKKYTNLQKLQINFFHIFIFSVLLCMCIILFLKLHGYKAITKKVNIGGKEYYDIFEDVIFYQDHKPRNNMVIDNLKWDFTFDYNQNCNIFLDLDAQWEIQFTASRERISEINIGLHGGDSMDTKNMNIEVKQGTSEPRFRFLEEQDDCNFLDVCLSSHVEKGKSDRISLKYNWEKFVIMDRKDDYIYLFPYAVAVGIKRFELVARHPYECKATVTVLKYKWGVEYSQTEITEENCSSMKIEIPEKKYGKEHKIVINDINAKNVYLIVFEKRPQR